MRATRRVCGVIALSKREREPPSDKDGGPLSAWQVSATTTLSVGRRGGGNAFFAAHDTARTFDRAAQPWINAATAQVGDRGVNFCIGGIAVFLQQYRRRHDDAGNAKAALRDIAGHKRLLQRMAPVTA
jgi:hypothetical protein